MTLETGPALKLIEAVRERRADAVITALPAPVDGLRMTCSATSTSSRPCRSATTAPCSRR